MIRLGEIQNLKVARKTDIGYILVTPNNEEVFLHNNETNFQVLNSGDNVSAFLFLDNKQRVAATLLSPLITKDQSAWLEVVGVNLKIGVFLSNNINKDILYSKDDLPKEFDLWPQIGDKLYVKLTVSKSFLAKPSYNRNQEELKLNSGDKVLASVVGLNDKGINLLTLDLENIFVEVRQLRKAYRIGEQVEVTINYPHPNYYTATLMRAKQEQRFDDASIILNHLKQAKIMNLTSDSSPEAIKEVFNMSKKAFKRALGLLYKQQKINFIEGKTILIGDKNE